MQTDNVYVSLFLEKEAARIRSELLKENHALRAELEALKTSSTVLLNEVQSRIANAEDKITEKAIDKTLVIIQQVKTWIGIAVLIFSAVFGLGALLGYKSLTDGLNVFLKTKLLIGCVFKMRIVVEEKLWMNFAPKLFSMPI